MAPLSPFLRFLTLILLNVPALHALEEESQGQPLEAFSRPVQPAVPRPRPRAKGATTTTTSTTGSLLRRARTTPIGADWTTTVSLGASGAQRIRLLIDTGSSLLWVLSAFQPAEQLHEDYADNSIYNASASPSWKPIRDLELEAFYGDGSYGARGLVGYERVALGNVSATMPVGAANETVGTLLGPEDDGILGLGFGGRDSSGRVRQPTFMMAVQDRLPRPVFTLELHAAETGSLNFGYVDQSKYSGQLTKVPINNRTGSSWLADGVTFSSGGKPVSSRPVSMWFDTGAVDTIIPESAGGASSYWSSVSGAEEQADGAWFFPCKASTPDLTYHIPGLAPITVPGAVLNNASAYTDSSGETCWGGVATNTVASAGYGFFLSFFTVWNQAEPSLSFAPYAGGSR